MVACRADQQAVAPRPAQDLHELEAIDGSRQIRADGHRAVSFEEHHIGVGRGLGDQRLGDPGCQIVAARLPERQIRQPWDEQRRLGQRGRIRDLTSEGEGHRCRQVGVGDRRDVAPGGKGSQVDREVR